MANIRITDLPEAVALDGTEILPIVQAGATKQADINSIVDFLGGVSTGALPDGNYGDVTVSGGGTAITINNGVVTYAKLQDVSATDRLLGRDTAGAGDVEELTVSGGVEFTGTGIQRSALTGDVTASAGSNATTIASDAVTNTKLANMAQNTFKGRVSAGTSDPEDLSSSQATSILSNFVGDSGAGGVKGLVPAPSAGDTAANKFLFADGTWQVTPASTTGITDGTKGEITVSATGTLWTINSAVVSNTKLAFMAANTIKGRITAGTSAPEDLTSSQATSILADFVGDSGAGGIKGLVPAPSSGYAAANRFLHADGTWQVTPASTAGVTDGNKGDITVGTTGTVWTINTGVVSDAKFRASAGLSVVGRSTTSSGDVADITTSSGSGAVFRESAGLLGFGTIATAGIANDAVTDAKLRNSTALSVIGRAANSSGDPADIVATAASDAVLRESGSALGFGTIATGGIANDAVTYAKIQNVSTTDRILGRDTAAAGDIEELTVSGGLEFTGTGIQRSALTGDVTASAGSSQTTIANNAVTNAKLADMTATTVKARGSTSTGDPEDIAIGVNLTLDGTSLRSDKTTLNTQTSTNYTLVAGDAGKIVEMNNAGANTLTVPSSGTVDFSTGTVVNVTQYGAGRTTITPAGGVTIRTRTGLLMGGQYAVASIYKKTANEWIAGGDISSV